MNQKEVDIFVFNEAKIFLLDETPKEITKDILDQYCILPEPTNETITLSKIYRGLLDSAQNSSMKSSVIGGSINGIDNLGKVLYNFNSSKTLDDFSEKPELLLETIKKELHPKGKIRETNLSIWPQYCKTILSAAKFLTQFKHEKEFLDWIDTYYNDKETISELPKIISKEVHGLGFALACDFLKDLGYSKFGKPDVHIKEIFEGTSLVLKNSSDYQILDAIIRISDNVNEKAYKVDKIFWLIGSGYFYKHKHLGRNGKVGKLKKKFIQHIDIKIKT